MLPNTRRCNILDLNPSTLLEVSYFAQRESSPNITWPFNYSIFMKIDLSPHIWLLAVSLQCLYSSSCALYRVKFFLLSPLSLLYSCIAPCYYSYTPMQNDQICHTCNIQFEILYLLPVLFFFYSSSLRIVFLALFELQECR